MSDDGMSDGRGMGDALLNGAHGAFRNRSALLDAGILGADA